MSVNVLGHIRMTKTFLPLMRRSSKDGGRIVNTTSTLARTFLPLVAPYCLTKSALDAFSTSLRRELASFNIDVVLIEPGDFAYTISMEFCLFVLEWEGGGCFSVVQLRRFHLQFDNNHIINQFVVRVLE